MCMPSCNKFAYLLKLKCEAGINDIYTCSVSLTSSQLLRYILYTHYVRHSIVHVYRIYTNDVSYIYKKCSLPFRKTIRSHCILYICPSDSEENLPNMLHHCHFSLAKWSLSVHISHHGNLAVCICSNLDLVRI